MAAAALTHTQGVSPTATIVGQHPLAVLYHNNKGWYSVDIKEYRKLKSEIKDDHDESKIKEEQI